MTVEHKKSLFSEEERCKEDNCVFFATLEYVRDQFGVELAREDFERFLKNKKKTKVRNGVPIYLIAKRLDSLLNSHDIKVSAILMRENASEFYFSRTSLRRLAHRIRAVGFFNDERIIENDVWNFPFLAVVGMDEDVNHLEYIADMERFDKVLARFGGEKDKISYGFVLNKKEA